MPTMLASGQEAVQPALHALKGCAAQTCQSTRTAEVHWPTRDVRYTTNADVIDGQRSAAPAASNTSHQDHSRVGYLLL